MSARHLVLTAALVSCVAHAHAQAPAQAPAVTPRVQTTWFTLQGDVYDPRVDTVQIEPETVVLFANLRTMRIRTSRSSERQGYDDLPYRSYVAMVHIDCTMRTARFRQIAFYSDALWKTPSRTAYFVDESMPRMAFRDMQPNPADRITTAACSIQKIKAD